MKKIMLVALVAFFSLFGVGSIIHAFSDVVEVKLRQHTFLIPKYVAMERGSVIPDWLLNMRGLDDDSNVTLFRFDDNEIKRNVSGYKIASNNQFKDDIEGLIIALAPQELSDYKNPKVYAQLAELWLGTDSYENRRVEAAEISGWYKVYRDVDYPNAWTLINQFPDPEKPVPDQVADFWVASCLMLGPEGERSGSCRTYELIDDIAVEFSVSDYNLPVLDRVRNFVRGQVLEWKQD